MAEYPCIVLERLHQGLAAANAEVDAVLALWRTSWIDPGLRERYYVAQDNALQIAQQIAAHRDAHEANHPAGNVENHVTGTAGAES